MKKLISAIQLAIGTAFILALCAGCGTLGNNQIDVGGFIIPLEQAAKVADMARPGSGAMILAGEARLQDILGKAKTDTLGRFAYSTTYQIVRADGTRIDVPMDAQIVAVDTPIPPTLPAPRIRTLRVSEIDPKIATANALEAAHSNVANNLNGDLQDDGADISQ